MSGRRDHEIEILFTVRFTIVSVMSFPWTVISPVMRADPERWRLVVGAPERPIPRNPPEVSTIF